jgi:hypothetical protein
MCKIPSPVCWIIVGPLLIVQFKKAHMGVCLSEGLLSRTSLTLAFRQDTLCYPMHHTCRGADVVYPLGVVLFFPAADAGFHVFLEWQ